MDSLTSIPQREQYWRTRFPALPVAVPVPPAVPSEEWEFLELNALKPSRTGPACITCQHFRYEVGRHCVSLLTCPIHQCPGLIQRPPQLTLSGLSAWASDSRGQSISERY